MGNNEKECLTRCERTLSFHKLSQPFNSALGGSLIKERTSFIVAWYRTGDRWWLVASTLNITRLVYSSGRRSSTETRQVKEWTRVGVQVVFKFNPKISFIHLFAQIV